MTTGLKQSLLVLGLFVVGIFIVVVLQRGINGVLSFELTSAILSFAVPIEVGLALQYIMERYS